MEETLYGLFERTMNNCRFYERENKDYSLCNEIGVLRGIAYCMELAGECPHTEEFIRYIGMQQKFKDKDKQ